MLAQRNMNSPVLQSTEVNQVDNAHFLCTSSSNVEQQQAQQLKHILRTTKNETKS